MANPHDKIAWAPKPDDARRKWVKILSPTPKEPVKILVCNSRLIGVYTHYMPGRTAAEKPRTQPCTGHKLFCPGCLMRRARRWKGYLGCWSIKLGTYFIAEVTREATVSCPALVDGQTDLRGQVIRLERMGTAPNSPVMARLTPAEPKTYLPAPLDVVSQLTRLWGFETSGWMGIDGTSGTGPQAPQLVPDPYTPHGEER